MNKRKIFLIITAFILTSIIAGSLGAVAVLAAWPFSDVNPGDWFYNDVYWLSSNGITQGCTASQYCPNSYVTRAEMAAFLHREAGALAAAGVHVTRDGANNPVIEDWFNNYNGVAPTIGGVGQYEINIGFTATDRFVMCTVDTNYVDTRDAHCNASTPSGNTVRVRIVNNAGWDTPGEFWLLVYGQ
jgi:hypothetical protein